MQLKPKQPLSSFLFSCELTCNNSNNRNQLYFLHVNCNMNWKYIIAIALLEFSIVAFGAEVIEIATSAQSNAEAKTQQDNLQHSHAVADALSGKGKSASDKPLRRKITPTDSDAFKALKPNNSTLKRVAENVAISLQTASNNSAVSSTPASQLNVTSTNGPSTNLTQAATISNATVVISNSSTSATSSTPSTSSTTAPTSTTTTTSSTTTSTTTTTPSPKKPLVTYGVEDFPNIDEIVPEKVNPPSNKPNNGKTQASNSTVKAPVTQESAMHVPPPQVQPSQEQSAFAYSHSRDYIFPMITIIFTVPLAIGIVITAYRRFRDCWTTRHYRRMDFLVDGMYND